jgi:hypothetical protein
MLTVLITRAHAASVGKRCRCYSHVKLRPIEVPQIEAQATLLKFCVGIVDELLGSRTVAWLDHDVHLVGCVETATWPAKGRERRHG